MGVRVISVDAPEPLDLDPADALPAYLSGAEFAGERVPFRSQDGRLGYVTNNREAIDDALSKGYTLANDFELQEAEVNARRGEQRAERENEPTLAFLEGLLPGEQVLSRVVQESSLLPDQLRANVAAYNERARDREELNPIASMAGQVTTEIAALAATGGASAIESIAGRGIASAAGRRFVAGAATNMGLEGVQVTGDVLAGNVENVAEEAAWRLGLAGVIGGTAEAGLPVLFRAASRSAGGRMTADEALDGIQRMDEAMGMAADEGVDGARAATHSDDRLDELREMVTFDELGQPTFEAGFLDRAKLILGSAVAEDEPRLLQMLADPTEHVQRQGREIARDLGKVATESQAVLAHFESVGKIDMVARLNKDVGRHGAQFQQARDVIDLIDKRTAELRRSGTVSDAFSRRLNDQIDEARRLLDPLKNDAIDQARTPFSVIDNLKKANDEFVTSRFGNDPRIARELREVNDLIRDKLADPVVWGAEISRRHTTWNASFRRYIARIRGPIRQALQKKTGEVVDDALIEAISSRVAQGDLSFQQALGVRGNVIEGLMPNLGTLGADELEGAIRGFVGDVDDLARVTDDVLDMRVSIEGAKPARGPGFPDSTVERTRLLGEVGPDGTTRTGGLLDSAKRDAIILRHSRGGAGALGETGARLVAGAVPGAGQSFALLPSVREAAIVKGLAWLNKSGRDAQKAFTKPVVDFMDGLEKRVKALGRPRGRPSRSRSRSRARSARLAGTRAFEDTVERMHENNETPDRVPQRIGRALGEFDAQFPKIAATMAQRFAAAHANMMARMPSGARARPDQLGALSRILPPELIPATDRIDYMRYVEATENPETVMEDLRNGTVTRTQVEALQDNWPAIYKNVVRTVIEQLAELEEAPPYQDRIQLSILLDQPLDPTVQPSFVASMQLSYTSQAETPAPTPPRAGGRSPGLASSSMSETQRLAAGRRSTL